MKLHDAVQELHLESPTALHSHHRHRGIDAADKGDVYPEETAEEPFVEDKPCHLQQGDDGELDGVSLPQDGSDGNEGRGRAHLGYHETVYGSVYAMYACQTRQIQKEHNPPPQTDADLPSVVPGLHSVENDGPLGRHGSHEEVEADAAEAISDEIGAQEAKS